MRSVIAGPIISLPPAPPPERSIPLAIVAEMHRLTTVPLDPRTGDPRDDWWSSLIHRLQHGCAAYLRSYEPDAEVDVCDKYELSVDGMTSVRVPSVMEIDVLDWRRPSERRTYDLRFNGLDRADFGIRLDPITDGAWCEMWRSLYAP